MKEKIRAFCEWIAVFDVYQIAPSKRLESIAEAKYWLGTLAKTYDHTPAAID